MATAMCQTAFVSQVAAPSRSSTFCGKALRVAPVTRAQAVKATTAAAADRQLWFPGNEAPKHLDGSLPGDYGFDPLSLGSDPEYLRWFQQAELVHCRVAMTAAAGIILPGLASTTGAFSVPEWYDAGKVWIQGHPAAPFGTLLTTTFLLSGWAEAKRWADFNNPGSQGDGSFLGIKDGLKGQSNGYPGGIFDPFGFSKGDKAKLETYKVQEIKNGRLAMVALVGFYFQHVATGKGPITNLVDHLADPYHVTFVNNGVSLPFEH